MPRAFPKPSLDWLLVFVPAAVLLRFFAPELPTWIFATAGLGMVPLAGWRGGRDRRTAQCHRIGLMALSRGLTGVVKASLAGRHKTRHFNARAARVQATMLTLAAIALIAPAAFHYLSGPGVRASESTLSTEISVIMLVVYAVSPRAANRKRSRHTSGGA